MFFNTSNPLPEYVKLLDHYLNLESVPEYIKNNPQIAYVEFSKLKESLLYLRRKLDKDLVSEIVQVC